MSNIPVELRYAESFEWIKKDGDVFLVGISDYAQNQLGDIVYVDFPDIGDEIKRGETLGEVESSKAVSEINMPFNGVVLEINEELDDSPELINSDPYESWIVKIKAVDTADYEKLMNSDEFRKMTEGE